MNGKGAGASVSVKEWLSNLVTDLQAGRLGGQHMTSEKSFFALLIRWQLQDVSQNSSGMTHDVFWAVIEI